MADFAKVLAAVDAELDMTGTDRYRQRAEHLTETPCRPTNSSTGCTPPLPTRQPSRAPEPNCSSF